MTKRDVVVLLLGLFISTIALQAGAQTVKAPIVQINPLYPRDGLGVEIRWTLNVTPSVHLGPVTLEPSPWGTQLGYLYGRQHTVTINQTAELDGGTGESTDSQVVNMPVEAGSYDVVLQLTVSGATTKVPLVSFVVPSQCSPEASASATYSWDTNGYELHFEDSLVNSSPGGRAALTSIEGNHVTVHQLLYIPGIPLPRPTCSSEDLHLGPLAPGTYRLTWVYDAIVYPKAAFDSFTYVRELTFEVMPPRRRSSRR